MKLQFLIPQYKENETIIKPLLDSIKNQRSVNFNDIGAIIVNDGTDIHLSNEFLNSYPFEIKYILNKHKGVSGTRNKCLDLAIADYIMFCDADDLFFNSLGLNIILNNLENFKPDAMTSSFVEELYIKDSNTFIYPVKENDTIFVHGKVYKRSYLKEKNIRWCEDLLIHEDSYFNSLALYSTENKIYCNSPFYLWCWREESVSRKDPFYIIKTYNCLLKSASKLSEDLEKRNLIKDSSSMFLVNLYQTFYLLTGKYLDFPELKDRLNSLNKLAKDFYIKFKHLLVNLNEDEKLQIKFNTNKAAMTQGWYKESISFTEWLEYILTL